MKTNAELNYLLDKAHSSQNAWDEWCKAGKYNRNEFWKRLYSPKEKAWNNLYQAIQESTPLVLVSTSGEHEIGTVEILTGDDMMYYSSVINSKWSNQGINLRSVKRIELQDVEGERND